MLAASGLTIEDLRKVTEVFNRAFSDHNDRVEKAAENFKKACEDLAASARNISKAQIVEKQHSVNPYSRRYKRPRR